MNTMIRVGVLVLIIVVQAGCVSSPQDVRNDEVPRVLAEDLRAIPIPSCPIACYEPTVAVDSGGRVFVTDVRGALARSLDGGRTFEELAIPPIPGSLGFDPGEGDVLVQVSPSGRLYYSSLVTRTIADQRVLEGLHVAWSADGGDSWPTNVWVSAFQEAGTPVVYPDRQWLAFGEGETVYLTYNQIPSGIWSSRSDDGGTTWSAWVRAIPPEGRNGGAGQSGPPVVDADGNIFVAGCSFDGASTFVMRSQDRGASFVGTAVATDGCTFFPVPMVMDDGSLVLAVMAPQASDAGASVTGGLGRIVVVRSADRGETWSAPVEWGRNALVGPWPVAVGAKLGIVWFAQNEGPELLATIGTEGGPDATRGVTSMELGPSEPGTHFPHAATMPDGRFATVWSTGESVAFGAFGWPAEDV